MKNHQNNDYFCCGSDNFYVADLVGYVADQHTTEDVPYEREESAVGWGREPTISSSPAPRLDKLTVDQPRGWEASSPLHSNQELKANDNYPSIPREPSKGWGERRTGTGWEAQTHQVRDLV